MYFCPSASLEDRGSLDDMERMFPLQDDYRYSTFLSGETSRDGKTTHSCKHRELARVASNMGSFHLLSGTRTSGLLPRGVKKEVRSS